jgi:hypothetical protein
MRTHNFLTLLIEIFILKRTLYHMCTLTYPKYKKKLKKYYYRRCLLRSVRAIPNVITHLSFVFPNNLIWLIYYIVMQ